MTSDHVVYKNEIVTLAQLQQLMGLIGENLSVNITNVVRSTFWVTLVYRLDTYDEVKLEVEKILEES